MGFWLNALFLQISKIVPKQLLRLNVMLESKDLLRKNSSTSYIDRNTSHLHTIPETKYHQYIQIYRGIYKIGIT